MKFDIVTFGSALIDVFVDMNLPEKNKKISFPVGTKIVLKNLKYATGGGGTNTAVGFARFGFKTGFVGKIGDDYSGHEILNELKKEKIKLLGKIHSGKQSGYSIVLDTTQHNRTILTFRGENNNLSINEIKKFKTKWIHFTSSLGKSFQTQIKLAKNLKKQEIKISYNPSCYVLEKENAKELIKLCDLLILNKEEAMLLTKEKNILTGLMKLGPKMVVVTDGKNKVSCSDGLKQYSLTPRKTKIIEKTGAGDAFATGFIAGQLVGMSINESLNLGEKEALSVMKDFGAKNNLLRMNLKKK